MVEDEAVIRECNTLALSGAGYRVHAVGEALAGWKALQARSFDILITDNRMPGELSGADLILKVRTARMNLPVILASGSIVPDLVAANSPLQPVTPLPKPFTAGQLLVLVAKVLRAANRSRAGRGDSARTAGESCLHWGLNE